MLLSCSDEDEVCDVIQPHITEINNIDYNECFFSLNDCLYDYNYKLSVNNNCNNDICECAYYLPEKLKAKMKNMPGFSVVHLNSRSLLANIDKIEMCLEELEWLFDVITVPETWIKESVSSYTMLENYQMCHTHRQDKNGGGVSIYIMNKLDFNKIYVLSTNIKDVMENVTVEICIK